MVVSLKKIAKYMIFFEIIYMIVINALCDYFVLPSIIKYLPDISTLFLFLYLIMNIKKIFENKKMMKLLYIIILFLVASLISFCINLYSPLVYAWGLRRFLRFFILFFSTYLSFEKKDVYRLQKTVNILFIVNIFVIMYQYFIFGLKRDYIGGTFSFSSMGGNVSLIPFLALNLFIFISKFQNKEINLPRLVLYLIPIVLIAAIAELKIMFIIIALALIIILIVNKKNLLRNICILVFAMIILSIASNLMISIYPEWGNLFDVGRIMEVFLGNEEYGYSTEYDLSRGRAIFQINERVFKDDYIKYFFGYGLGNCDYSSISIFTSDFYNMYGNVLHHTWFMHSLYYLENGGIGFLIYISFFVVNIYYTFKISRKIDSKENNTYLYTSLLCSIVTLLLIVYNEFLKIDTSFFWYAILCVPYIMEKESEKNEV